jgi:hypothetical protein
VELEFFINSTPGGEGLLGQATRRDAYDCIIKVDTKANGVNLGA